jgi:hypothetical protein
MSLLYDTHMTSRPGYGRETEMKTNFFGWIGFRRVRGWIARSLYLRRAYLKDCCISCERAWIAGGDCCCSPLGQEERVVHG